MNNDLCLCLSADVLRHLTREERGYLDSVFKRFDGYPRLEQIWLLMDEAWEALGCDPNFMDERIIAFYRHPVWLLNGLFIEQHSESLAHRRAFTEWIVRQAPKRVADFGGGFGTLARFVGQALPQAQVEIVEPHPHPVAIALAASTPNVRYVPRLTGEYDLLIATDVFEHVPDPLGLCEDTAAYLKVNGLYLIANCFYPVIKCHLPQLFYFACSWDAAMQAMGLIPEDRVRYGRAYRRRGELDLASARQVSDRARSLYPFICTLPLPKKGYTRLSTLAMTLLVKLTMVAKLM